MDGAAIVDGVIGLEFLHVRTPSREIGPMTFHGSMSNEG